MAIPSRQIGWSQESNLLWQLSKQLEKLTNVVAATAAGGMLNPTTNYIPFNSGLAFGDSYLVNDTTSSVLKTVYTGNDVGLKLDFANNVYKIGDYTGNILYDTHIEVDSTNSFILLTGNSSGTQFLLNDLNSLIKTQYNAQDIGLKLDFANNQYSLGDLNANYNFVVDGPNGRCVMGDFNGNVNGTQLEIDDVNQVFSLSGNLLENNAGTSSGQYLKIRVGGVDYKIALLNN